MTNTVLLDNVAHAGLTVSPARGARFGDAVNRVPVFPTEFAAVQREYPILFGTDDEGDPQAYALLGFDRDENLFLEDDRWTGRYVPALLARGPFSIGLRARDDGEREPMIHVDLDDPRVGPCVGPRVGADGGEPVFLPHGGNSAYLDHVADVLRRIHVGYGSASTVLAAFGAAGLIRPVTLEVTIDDTLRYDIADFGVINDEGLAQLDAAALASLHRQGFLALAFHAGASLGTLPDLIERKNRRRSA